MDRAGYCGRLLLHHYGKESTHMFYVIAALMGAFLFVLGAFCFLPVWLILGLLFFGSAKAGFVIYCFGFVLSILAVLRS
jgi:hypothetical protein